MEISIRDVRVEVVSGVILPLFQTVGDEMLAARGDLGMLRIEPTDIALESLDKVCRVVSCKLRIFTRDFLVASPAGIALHVQRRAPVIDAIAVLVLGDVISKVIDRPSLSAIHLPDHEVQ